MKATIRTKQTSLKMKQTSFAFLKNFKPEFGGELLAGKRKTLRPLSTKHCMHFVLKSNKAKGNLAFINHLRAIENVIAQTSKRFHVKLVRFVVNNDHVHFVVRIHSRDLYKQWIRALTSNIVNTLSQRTGLKLTSFFTLRPFSRIITWGRDLKTALNYLIKNEMEYFGIYRSRPASRKSKRREQQCEDGSLLNPDDDLI